jgi:hypothetical protein
VNISSETLLRLIRFAMAAQTAQKIHDGRESSTPQHAQWIAAEAAAILSDLPDMNEIWDSLYSSADSGVSFARVNPDANPFQPPPSLPHSHRVELEMLAAIRRMNSQMGVLLQMVKHSGDSVGFYDRSKVAPEAEAMIEAANQFSIRLMDYYGVGPQDLIVYDTAVNVNK